MGADSSRNFYPYSKVLPDPDCQKPDVQTAITQWPVKNSEGLEGRTSDKVPTYALVSPILGQHN